MITSVLQQKYPDFFPDNCPPMDSNVTKQKLFRFCKSKNISSDDFVSYYEANPEKFKGNILSYGLSVMKSRDDCIKAYKKFPYMHKFKTIAVGETNESRGCWKNTPNKSNPTHVTWWVCEGVNPVSFFQLDYVIGE